MCFLLLVLLPWHKVQNLKSSKGFYGQPSGAPIMSHVQDNLWNSRMYVWRALVCLTNKINFNSVWGSSSMLLNLFQFLKVLSNCFP